MKQQGRADHSGMSGVKREPIPHAVNVSHIAEEGLEVVRHTKVPMYSGRGLEAPMVGTTIHYTGSQGKHK